MLGKRTAEEAELGEAKVDAVDAVDSVADPMTNLPLELRAKILGYLPQKELNYFLTPEPGMLQHYYYKTAHAATFARKTTQACQTQMSLLRSWTLSHTVNPSGMQSVDIEQTLVDRMKAKPLDFEYNVRCAFFIAQRQNKPNAISQISAGKLTVQSTDFIRAVFPLLPRTVINEFLSEIITVLEKPFGRPDPSYYEMIKIMKDQWNAEQIERLINRLNIQIQFPHQFIRPEDVLMALDALRLQVKIEQFETPYHQANQELYSGRITQYSPNQIERLLPYQNEAQKQQLFQDISQLVFYDRDSPWTKILYKLSLVADDASLTLLRKQLSQSDLSTDLIQFVRDNYQEAVARCDQSPQALSRRSIFGLLP